MNYRNNWW